MKFSCYLPNCSFFCLAKKTNQKKGHFFVGVSNFATVKLEPYFPG